MGRTWASRGVPAPHFLTSTYSLAFEQLLGNSLISAHWKWELGAVGCLIQHWIETALYSWVEVWTPDNQHEANTGKSRLNSARDPPLLLSTAKSQLSMEKLCTVTHLSEIHQIYTCRQNVIFLHVAHRDNENLIILPGMEILILDCQT